MAEVSFFEKVEKIKMVHRVLILFGTIVLLGGLFIWFVYIPKTGQIASDKKEIEDLELKINQARIRAKSLGKFKAEMAKVDDQFKQALRLLPNQREIPSLLRSVTQLGSDSNLEFRLFSPKKERPRDFFIEIPVSVQVSGGYHDVAVFFDKVGRMERIINIIDVTMKPVKPRSTRLLTSCEAVTYRFKGSPDAKPKKKQKKK